MYPIHQFYLRCYKHIALSKSNRSIADTGRKNGNKK